MVSDLEVIHRGEGPLEQDTANRRRLDMASRLEEFETNEIQTSIDLQRLVTRAYVDVMRRALDEAGIRPHEIERVFFFSYGQGFDSFVSFDAAAVAATAIHG